MSIKRPRREPRFIVRIPVTASNIVSLRKKLTAALGDQAAVEIDKVNLSMSRADRLAAAQADIQGASDDIEDIKSELESWKDNLPESLQNGDKAEQLDTAVSQLDDLISDINALRFDDVEFPTMF